MGNLHIGIDPSYTNTGVIVIDDDGKVFHQFCCQAQRKAKGNEAYRPVDLLLDMIRELSFIKIQIAKKRDFHVMIEYPMSSFRGGASSKVNEAFASCACAVSIAFGFNARICYPPQWKSYIGAKHMANMKIVKAFMDDKYQMEFPNLDLYSAYGIALYLRGKILKVGS